MSNYKDGYYIGRVPNGLCDDIYPERALFLCIRDKFYIPGCQGAFSPNEDWMQMIELTRISDDFVLGLGKPVCTCAGNCKKGG